ncbi:MAG: tRNA uridine-5-carboxymethylaminomethyl(34) synthesis GTPase MnmE [Bacteroidaceae bacterium]|nr:tRNA uridine-5-carboxymethylaminomethyl(34) synthesis GTPase MnmE [Bacteroidaceae bacterium]
MATNETPQERRSGLLVNQLTPICAPATAPGGALSVVRVSGEGCIALCDTIFHAKNGRTLSDTKGGSVRFGYITSDDGTTLDEVLASVFRAPHSYTGQDSVEFSCHASPYIVAELLRLLCQAGCRTAEPGEFTRRAFLAGKLDLSQAEAVADLISARTCAAHRVAMNQLRGSLYREFEALHERLLRLSSLLELELDFADHEDLEFADRTELLALCDELDSRIAALLSTYRVGDAVRHGLPVCIVGDTNAGKSTLLNRLVGDDRAIVSDTRGTTRDLIEDTVQIGGTTFRFIDTAGIRDTDDTVERIGIDRALAAVSRAEIVLWVVDATRAESETTALAPRLAPLVQDKPLLLLLNKTDLLTGNKKQETINIATQEDNGEWVMVNGQWSMVNGQWPMVKISAKTGDGIPALQSRLAAIAADLLRSDSDTILTNARHTEAFARALDAIRRARRALADGLSGEFVAQDLALARNALAEIVGRITPTSILHSVFQNFCVGK